MIHCYKLTGMNIVLDICSGSVHVVDEVTYDIIEMYEQKEREEIIGEILKKYPNREDVTRQDIEDCFADIEELKDFFTESETSLTAVSAPKRLVTRSNTKKSEPDSSDTGLSHIEPASGEEFLQFGNRDHFEVENACGQKHRRSGLGGLGEMLHCAGSARRDDIGIGDLSYPADERQVISGAHAVGRLRCGQNRPDSVAVHLLRPFDGVPAGGGAPAVNVDLIS